ncbi:MAG TPA: protein kinase [Gemmatimonadales bacterium]|nr:protein kinase [Gemmatimonadales bacterium]
MSLMPAGLAAILTDRYRVERELGQGGMATVYLAQDLKHDRQVALKVLKPELGAVLGSERFLSEIKITARLDHPHILTLLDSGAVEGLLYYVLPYVRGESLRVLLNRETQLGVDDALAITKQIASALDYAHRQGVVHRDIKPENIMILEGEAMLTDFGIALAVKEAGGSRLTETGLSLGTPHYMSPEQATGDRQLDARSDLYSLAAVTYEMLTGEPPTTGPTVQAVIAKLLTDAPTRIRTVRPTVPEGIDNAVAKALAKVPADRYATVGDFAKALELTRSTAAVGAPAAAKKSMLRYAAFAGVVAIVAALAWGAFRGAKSPSDGLVALRDRNQITFDGNTFIPAMSQDGKQLAYWVRQCQAADCSYAIVVQDIGSTTTRRIIEGATSAWGLEWSPDRRNLIAFGTVNGRYGSFLISAQGGPARYLTAGAATFYAGGDSLLLGQAGSDSVFAVRFASLDGVVHDSIEVVGPGASLGALLSMPGTPYIIAQVIQGGRGLWQVLDRKGKVMDRLLNSCTCGGSPAQDAIWMVRAGQTVSEAVVRVGIDPKTGKFAEHQDTVYNGRFSGISVTADGSQFMVDDGSYTFAALPIDFADMLSGKGIDATPLLSGSTQVRASVSPDGGRLLLRRSVPTPAGGDELKVSISPYPRGTETALPVTGRLFDVQWADSVTVATRSASARGNKLQLVDVRDGSVRNTLEVADSTFGFWAPLPDGWGYINDRGDRITVEQGGKRHDLLKPAWAANFANFDVSSDGSRMVYSAWNASTQDTLGVFTVDIAGGEPTKWAASFSELGLVRWSGDGSVVFANWLTANAVTLSKFSAPGTSQVLGTVPHPLRWLSVSDDLKRATIGWRDYRGDAWLYRVVKPN